MRFATCVYWLNSSSGAFRKRFRTRWQNSHSTVFDMCYPLTFFVLRQNLELFPIESSHSQVIYVTFEQIARYVKEIFGALVTFFNLFSSVIITVRCAWRDTKRIHAKKVGKECELGYFGNGKLVVTYRVIAIFWQLFSRNTMKNVMRNIWRNIRTEQIILRILYRI